MSNKSKNSLLGHMDESTKQVVRQLQEVEKVPLTDGRILEEIDVTLIEADKKNIRQDNEDYDHESLSRSIEDLGLLQPITLTKKGDKYIISTGEQRWTSWMLLYQKDPKKYARIPSIVQDKSENEISNSTRIKTQVAENFSRFDGSIFDLADAIIELWETEGKEYAISALAQTRHASNNTALSRLKSIASTTIDFRKKINNAGIEGKGTIETLSKINKKNPLIFRQILDDYEDGSLEISLDKKANSVWGDISGKAKPKKTLETKNKQPSTVNTEKKSPLNEAEKFTDKNSSLTAPTANLYANSIEIIGDVIKVDVKNGSELLIKLPKGLVLEVSN